MTVDFFVAECEFCYSAMLPTKQPFLFVNGWLTNKFAGVWIHFKIIFKVSYPFKL